MRGARGWFGGGRGRCGVFCLPRFPLPAPHLLCCVWQAVPSGCPLSSLAGTPFHAVCVFRGLGPVALLVFPACPLCGRALALSRRPRPPPPPRVGVARAARAVPVLGAGRAVPRGPCPSACPASVSCSVWLALGGGGGPVPFSPTWLGAARSPLGGCGRGERHQHHRARSCELALRAVGAASGCPGGAPLAWVWGVRGPALSQPRPLVLSGVRPGPTTHWLSVRGVRAWGPVTNPAATLLQAGFGRCGGGTRAPGGSASCQGVGRLGSGTLPPPTTRPFRVAAGAHYPLAVDAGVAGVRTRHQPHNARSCELALRAVGAAQGRPGGAPLAWVWGVRGRALSQPRPLILLGVWPGPTTHWLWVRGVLAWGPVTNPTAKLLRACFARCGGSTRAPGGGAPLAWVCGVRGRALSHPRPLVLLNVRPGPTTHWLWVRGKRA